MTFKQKSENELKLLGYLSNPSAAPVCERITYTLFGQKYKNIWSSLWATSESCNGFIAAVALGKYLDFGVRMLLSR
jgi:hypothetical protein